MIRAVFKYNEIHLAEKDIQKTFFFYIYICEWDLFRNYNTITLNGINPKH